MSTWKHKGELKQQSGYCPPPCPSNTLCGRHCGTVSNCPCHALSFVRRQQRSATVPAPIIVTAPIVEHATRTPRATPVPEQAKNRYQIALFVASDAKSQRLLEWFNTDRKALVKFRQSKCAISRSTLKPMHCTRTRFANIVPANQFPVVLFPGLDRRACSCGRLTQCCRQLRS